jgi:hypothetical protein
MDRWLSLLTPGPMEAQAKFGTTLKAALFTFRETGRLGFVFRLLNAPFD